METEVKFKGTDRKGEVHFGCYSNLTLLGMNEHEILSLTRREAWVIDPKTLGQYIGRKDIHGQDIYTNDKVKTNSQAGTIEYNPETLCYILRRTDNTFIRLDVIIDKIEII